jgi:hypothetical protein
MVGGAQSVFCIRSAKIQNVHSISMSSGCSLTLAQSDLCRPRGAYGIPRRNAYEDALRSLLRPGSHAECTMVHNDPMTGMPAYLYGLAPAIGLNGDFIMEPAEAPLEATTAMWGSSSLVLRDVPPAPAATPAAHDGDIRADMDPVHFNAARLDDHRGLTFTAHVKKGKSGARRADYAMATTVGEYQARCTAFGTMRTLALKDLAYTTCDTATSCSTRPRRT